MNTEENKAGSAALYLLSGAAIGAVLGVLFAPKKGSELRADIGEFGNETVRKGQRFYSRAKRTIPAKISAVVGAAQKAGHDVIREAKQGVGQLVPGRSTQSRRSHRGRGRPA